jgi:hypothetical protein
MPLNRVLLSFLSVILASCATNADHQGRALSDWSGGLIQPDVQLNLIVRGTAPAIQQVRLCETFGQWLEQRDFTLFDCSMRRVITEPTSAADIYVFRGLVLPNSWNGDVGQNIGARGAVATGRRSLGLISLPAQGQAPGPLILISAR